MRRLRSILACGAAAALVAAGATGVAYADIVVADGDTAVNNSNMAFGAVICNETMSRDATLWIERKSASNNSNAFANGAVVTFKVTSVTGSGLTASDATNTVTLPENWISLLDRTTSNTTTATVRLTSRSPGSGSGKVTYEASGNKYGGGTLTLTDAFNVSWTTGTCTTNTAPSVPGAPAVNENPTQGGFTLSWTPSSDTENDAFTYTLEGKDADDAGWSSVATGLTNNSYSFGTVAPAEGTWTYRVKAVESSTSPALSSDWSASSSPVVVDRTGPTAPTASADRTPEYTGDGKSWWKDSVTVSFQDNGDPALPDGSSGSGVADVTDAQTVSGPQGSFTESGTATDAAGNISEAETFSGYVDNAAPVVMLSCPQPVILGSTSTASWTASDEGGSGIAGATSGDVTLDTSAVGLHTATAGEGTVSDNVGHPSAAKTCDYSVVYDFAGFFRPVDMGDVMNVAKAGSAIPIKFSLHGDQGLNIIGSGYPTFTITGTATSGDLIEETVTSGNSGLTYDPLSDQYSYVWKTDKAWAGKAGLFTLKLDDGTSHTATFSFMK